MGKRVSFALSTLWNKMLHTPDVNSRIVFLAHSGVSVIGTMILVIAFIHATDKTGYDSMVLSLNGAAGVGGAVGRYLTKKNSAEEEELPKPPVV